MSARDIGRAGGAVVGVGLGALLCMLMAWCAGHAAAWLWCAIARPGLWFSADTATGVAFVLLCMRWLWNWSNRPARDEFDV